MMDTDINLLDDDEKKQSKPQYSQKIPLIYAWGRNVHKELGLGRQAMETVDAPSAIESFKGFARQIGTARSHTAILNQKGQIYFAGETLLGKIGIPSKNPNLASFTLHRQMSQYVVKKVAVGDYHTLALLEDGTVFSWGGTLGEKTGHKETGVSRMEKLVGQCITDIACGDYHSIALNSTGKVYSWGGGGKDRNKGQLGHSDTEDKQHPQEIIKLKKMKISKIACGDYHTMVLTDKGDIYAFGEGNAGQLGTGGKQSTGIPKKVKMNFEIAIEDYFRTDINEETKIQQIALGGRHSLLLTNKGHVYVCGYGSQGQLGMGQGRTKNVFEPQLVKALLGKKVVMIAAGAYHSLALTSKHDIFCCGSNNEGQLGLNQQKSATMWTHITDLSKKKVGKIYAGGSHSWAVVDEVTPFIVDYEPPSPIKLSIDQATFIKHNDSGSRPQKSVNSMDEILVSLTPHRKLQLILTQVQKSHRFIHFVAKQNNPKALNKKIEEYIAFVYENQKKNVKFHRVTEDGEMFDGKGKLILNSNTRGRTIMFVADIPQDATEYLSVKTGRSTIGIGDMIMMSADMLKNQSNKVPLHNLWFFKFHQIFDEFIQRARFIQLRPKLI